MQESLISLLDFLGLAWWVEIKTNSPQCVYYFGPFLSANEAENAKPGYIEDLQGEGAQGITVIVKRCKPARLTIVDEGGEFRGKPAPSFSSPMP
ncbi:protein of unknown function DUF1816 [Leptolyngbyaceae cyanobacterium JSC-12]|nr:protein of unknown function DUF1816 [Leptolyngbyaceae cyanobacterium JSC-12]